MAKSFVTRRFWPRNAPVLFRLINTQNRALRSPAHRPRMRVFYLLTIVAISCRFSRNSQTNKDVPHRMADCQTESSRLLLCYVINKKTNIYEWPYKLQYCGSKISGSKLFLNKDPDADLGFMTKKSYTSMKSERPKRSPQPSEKDSPYSGKRNISSISPFSETI